MPYKSIATQSNQTVHHFVSVQSMHRDDADAQKTVKLAHRPHRPGGLALAATSHRCNAVPKPSPRTRRRRKVAYNDTKTTSQHMARSSDTTFPIRQTQSQHSAKPNRPARSVHAVQGTFKHKRHHQRPIESSSCSHVAYAFQITEHGHDGTPQTQII